MFVSLTSSNALGLFMEHPAQKRTSNYRQGYRGDPCERVCQQASGICHPNSLASVQIMHVTAARSSVAYTLYHYVLEDTRTGRKWSIARRYTDFDRFRSRLVVALEGAHCSTCSKVCLQLKNFSFPPRVLWGSRLERTVSLRKASFTTYLQKILEWISSPRSKFCPVLNSTLRTIIFRFLTSFSLDYTSMVQNGSPEAHMKYQGCQHAIPCLLDEWNVARPSYNRRGSLDPINELD